MRSAPKAPSLSAIDQELGGALKAKVISGLDALRALAISLVLLDHYELLDHLWGGRHLYFGSLGVMIFFVLSGFLITSMLLKEYRRSGSISLRNFYRRRAYRIFPTFYVCWIITTIVECLAHTYRWKTSVVSFFYLMDYGRALFPLSERPYLHLWISWSLAIEEKFYLLWPLLLLLLLKRQSALIRTMCAIIAGLWIYRAILFLGFHVSWEYLYSAFEMRADSLLTGCLLSILVERERTRAYFLPRAPLAVAGCNPRRRAGIDRYFSRQPCVALSLFLVDRAGDYCRPADPVCLLGRKVLDRLEERNRTLHRAHLLRALPVSSLGQPDRL